MDKETTKKSKATQRKNETTKKTKTTQGKNGTTKTAKTAQRKNGTTKTAKTTQEKNKTTKKTTTTQEKNAVDKNTEREQKEILKVNEEDMEDNKKEGKIHKFINIIKKKWLIQGTTTAIFVAAIIAIFIVITEVLQGMNLEPIDLSQEKLYTLSEDAKNQAKEINKDVNIYFTGVTEDDTNYELAKQYTNINEHIKVEIIDPKERIDLKSKYQLEDETQAIIIECGERSKILSSYDLVTYDSTSGETISIADEKLTSSIVYVTQDKLPKIYILDGYSLEMSSQTMQNFQALIQNEAIDIEALNVISTGKIPEDCDTLIINSPNKDFDDMTTQYIKDYINAGGNILWFNTAVSTKVDMPHVSEILSEYGINPFDVGIILEGDTSKMAASQPYMIFPEIQYSDITEDLQKANGQVLFLNSTKINIEESDKLEEKKVTETPLLKASDKSFFRSDVSSSSMSKIASDEQGPFTVATLMEKTIKDEDTENQTPAVKSKLAIFGENYFVSDMQLSQQQAMSLIELANNSQMAIDVVTNLVDREDAIISRKSTGTVTYTPTEQQNVVILAIIFTIPVLIIVIGIIVWLVRRRKK